MTSVPADPLIGQTLDERYVIRSRIARGGMAMVYLAQDLRLERKVAVKVMHPHLAEDENFRRRFEQEARSAAGLSHPNLVGVFDQGHDAGHTYLVMEYLPSITLRALLKQQKRLTTEQATEISEAVLSGLAAAHDADIVHRDLKPENVMLADDGRIKLGDFGLARAVSANTTTGQALLGTIAYLSPELITRGLADTRSDIYAFGIMLYEMLTGEQPFTGDQPMQIAYQHANSEVPAPSLKSPEVTPELDELVLWATQRDPEHRPRDAREALDHLKGLRSGPTVDNATRVLDVEEGVHATPSTAVLDDAMQQELAAPRDTTPPPPAEATTPTDVAVGAGQRRAKRGTLIAMLIVAVISGAGFAGWWFGQGPGSQVAVPDVVGLDVAAAKDLLEQDDLSVELFECSSLEVPAGQAAHTEPESGTRLDRGSTVRLCQSTGPEAKPVPTIVGLTVEEATATIEEAGFTFGEVLEEHFSDQPQGTVLAALGEDGSGLGETYPEQARVDLITSAGPVPSVAGKTAEEARTELAGVGLTVDDALREEAHSDDVPEGSVLEVVLHTDPVRPGDSVGLRLSLGPELFEVPRVEGMTLREAIDALSAAGFTPTTSPIFRTDELREIATATGTNPAEGEKVPAGTEIYVTASLFG